MLYIGFVENQDHNKPYIPPRNKGRVQKMIIAEWLEVSRHSKTERQEVLIEMIADYAGIGSGIDIVAILDGILVSLSTNNDRIELLEWFDEESTIQPNEDDEYSNLLLQWNLLRSHKDWDEVNPISWIRKRLFELQNDNPEIVRLNEYQKRMMEEMKFQRIEFLDQLKEEKLLSHLEPFRSVLSEQDFDKFISNTFALLAKGDTSPPKILNLTIGFNKNKENLNDAFNAAAKNLKTYNNKSRNELAKAAFYSFPHYRNPKSDKPLSVLLKHIRQNF